MNPDLKYRPEHFAADAKAVRERMHPDGLMQLMQLANVPEHIGFKAQVGDITYYFDIFFRSRSRTAVLSVLEQLFLHPPDNIGQEQVSRLAPQILSQAAQLLSGPHPQETVEASYVVIPKHKRERLYEVHVFVFDSACISQVLELSNRKANTAGMHYNFYDHACLRHRLRQ